VNPQQVPFVKSGRSKDIHIFQVRNLLLGFYTKYCRIIFKFGLYQSNIKGSSNVKLCILRIL
jgi:hypothetical protein